MKNLKKRIASIITAAAVAFGSLGVLPEIEGLENLLMITSYAEAADNVTVTTWAELKAALSAGGNIRLGADVTAGASDTSLEVPTGKTVILDLNGHTIDRGLTSAIENGYVITNSGSLTINDSGTTGKITGGYNSFNGGGICNSGTLTITGGTISGNTAASFSSGGGVDNNIDSTFTMYGGTISGNTANKGGGVYNNSDTFTMYGGEISGNTASNGGGVYNISDTFTMYGGEISGNTASSGGGVYNYIGTITLSGGEISENTASGSLASYCGGGGVYINSGTLTMEGVEVSGNYATYSVGGGVYVKGGTLVLKGGEISENQADQGGGVMNDGTFTMEGGLISGNKAVNTIGTDSSGYGGGVSTGGVLTISGGTIAKNEAKCGGGIFSWYSDAANSIKGCVITENNAEKGGGIYNTGNLNIGGTGDLEPVTISNNTASNIGGGICNGGTTSVLTITNSAVLDNTASDFGGGGIYNIGTLTMDGGAICGNKAKRNYYTGGGGGIHHGGSSFTVKGSPVIYNNTDYDGAPNNVNIYNGKTITIGDNFSDDAVIGVTVKTTPTEGHPTLIVNEGITENNIRGFFSDADGLKVEKSDVFAVLTYCPDARYGIEFTEWTDELAQSQYNNDNTKSAQNSLPKSGGSYKLTADVILNDTWTVTASLTNLDLNGHSIRLDENVTGKSVISVYHIVFNPVLNLFDSNTSVTHYYTIDHDTHEVTISDISSVGAKSFKGGYITGAVSGNSTDYAYGVRVYSSFKMFGGTIIGNRRGEVPSGGICSEPNTHTRIIDGNILANGDSGVMALNRNDGVNSNNSIVEMYSGRISDNNAPCGGGVENTATFIMYGGKISGNTAAGGDGRGGGVHCNSNVSTTKFTMFGGEISDNAAINGGGVFNDRVTFTMSGGKIINNTASNDGGGVYNNGLITSDTTKFIMIGGDISDNTATNGGGVYNYCSNGNAAFTMSGGKISGNMATASGDNSKANGGGVYNYCSNGNAAFTMSGGKISGNTATASGEESKACGGGICNDNGTFTMSGGKISGNTATASGEESKACGGGIYSCASTTLNMEGGSISGNSAAYGGGVYVNSAINDPEQYPKMSGGTVSGNTATYGGGIYVERNMNVTGGVISGNTAAKNGGGIYTCNGLSVINGVICGNTAAKDGGGIASISLFTLKDSVIIGNTAAGNGGGVSLDDDNTNSCKISGSTKIICNKKGTADNNLYIPTTGVIGFDLPLADILIGVTMKTPGVFTTGFSVNLSGDPAKYFVSDSKTYGVEKVPTGETHAGEARLTILHSPVWVAATAGNCITPSTVGHYHCDLCDKDFSDEECTQELTNINGDYGDHSYSLTTTKPTCTTAGANTYTCKWCNDTNTETIAALGHKYTSKVTTKATCTTDGVRTFTCSRCNDTYTEKIAAPGHKYTSKITTKPTCTAEGVMTYTCSRCNDTYTESIAALGHDYVNGYCTHCGAADPNYNGGGHTPSYPTGGGSTTTTTKEPRIVGGSGASSWNNIAPEIAKTPEGGTVTVDMNGTTTVPANVFDAFKGRTVVLVLDMGGGVKWTINGKNITGVSGAVDLGVKAGTSDIPAEVRNNLSGKKYSTTLHLNHSGALGFKAVLTVPLRKQDAGMFANLFCYDPAKEALEFVSSAKIDKNGTADLEFDHASDYAIVVDDHSLDRQEINAAVDGSSVKLSWDAVPGAKSYTVYKLKDGKYVKLKTTTKTALKVNKLKNSRTYKFRVKAEINGDLTEVYKADVKLCYKPVLKAKAGNGSITLKWSEVNNAGKYRVMKYTGGEWKKVKETSKTSLNIKNVKTGKKYRYAVQAYVNEKWTEIGETSTAKVKVK